MIHALFWLILGAIFLLVVLRVAQLVLKRISLPDDVKELCLLLIGLLGFLFLAYLVAGALELTIPKGFH